MNARRPPAHAAPDHRPQPRWRSRWRTVTAVLGVTLMVGGAGLLWSMQHYRQRSAATAHALIDQLHAQTSHDTHRPAEATCTAPPPSAATGHSARAILAIPTLGLTAPVLAGTDDTALDSGVGHLDTSHWPDQGGTAVLEAHDVTFFAHLPQLKPGDQITISAPCRAWTYTVATGTVATAGSPVANNPAPTLVLITCYPSDALFLTNQRYILTANLTTASTTATPAPATLPTTPTVQTVHAALPAALSPADLTVDSVHLPLGRLHLNDPADPSGYKSAGGFQASQQATALLVAAERAATEKRPDWWNTIAPTVPYTHAATLAGPAHWTSPVNLTITATNGTITAATATGTLNRFPHPITITFGVTETTMTITNITT